MHILISPTDYLISRENFLLGSVELAAYAVIFLFILIIEHIYIQIPLKAGGASEIQFSLARLSHVANSSFPVIRTVYPSVNIGENAYPSRT